MPRSNDGPIHSFKQNNALSNPVDARAVLTRRFGRNAFDVQQALDVLGPGGGGLLHALYRDGLVRMGSDGRLLLNDGESAIPRHPGGTLDAARMVLEQARYAQADSERQMAAIARRLQEIEERSATILESHRRTAAQLRGGRVVPDA